MALLRGKALEKIAIDKHAVLGVQCVWLHIQIKPSLQYCFYLPHCHTRAAQCDDRRSECPLIFNAYQLIVKQASARRSLALRCCRCVLRMRAHATAADVLCAQSRRNKNSRICCRVYYQLKTLL